MRNFLSSFFKFLNRKERAYVFGDSHTEVFEFINSEYASSRLLFDVTKVGGATAQGLVNPNSETNCLEIFTKKINSIRNKKSKLFFMLGEVDTGFVIWYRASKYSETVEFQMNRSIENYFSFLKDVQALGFKHIYVLSAPLPTIKDNQEWGEVANLRRAVKATQVERTLLTLNYNERLKSLCSISGFKFIAFDDELLDKNKNVIKEEFLNEDKNNHHLNVALYSKLCFDKLTYVFPPRMLRR